MPRMKQILKEARALITDPEHWTQGDHAIENTGASIDPLNEAAYAWCADGALCRVLNRQPEFINGYAPYKMACAALDAALARVVPLDGKSTSLVALNDAEIEGIETAEACHAAVLSVFDDAIKHA